MTPTSSQRTRRWLALAGPVLFLAALVLVGRRAALSDAAASPSSAQPVLVSPALGDATAADGDSAIDGVDGVDGATVGRACEFLPDGAVMVDINRATEEELRKLPGIGPGRARKIVELRVRLGRFKTVEDLARIKGFGRSLLKRIRPWVRVS